MLAAMETVTLLQRLWSSAALRDLAEVPLIWLCRARTRRQLRELDAHALADVGLDATARDAECARWGWEGRSLEP